MNNGYWYALHKSLTIYDKFPITFISGLQPIRIRERCTHSVQMLRWRGADLSSGFKWTK